MEIIVINSAIRKVQDSLSKNSGDNCKNRTHSWFWNYLSSQNRRAIFRRQRLWRIHKFVVRLIRCRIYFIFKTEAFHCLKPPWPVVVQGRALFSARHLAWCDVYFIDKTPSSKRFLSVYSSGFAPRSSGKTGPPRPQGDQAWDHNPGVLQDTFALTKPSKFESYNEGRHFSRQRIVKGKAPREPCGVMETFLRRPKRVPH